MPLKQSFLYERSESFDDHLIESLKAPEQAALYLQVALEEFKQEGDTDFFVMALKNIAKAWKN